MGKAAFVPVEELKQVPFFNAAAWNPSRYLSCLTFYAKGEWHFWIPTPDGLRKLIATPVQAQYFGDSPERPTDQYFALLNLMAQRASYSGEYWLARGIWEDFQNLAASLAKMRLFFDVSTSPREVGRFTQTELEYIIFVCRSIFDLLQELVAAQWERIELFDKSKKKQKLPPSFRSVLFHEGKLQNAEQIANKYGLPMVMAEWYVQQAEFFLLLRDIRDKMTHSGRELVEFLFVTERGFAILRDERPWCQFHDWPEECELPNRLVPLRPVVCAIIKKVIGTCDSFAHMLEKTIQLPGELFPGMIFYSRGYHDHELAQIEDAIEHSWWCDEGPADPGREPKQDG